VFKRRVGGVLGGARGGSGRLAFAARLSGQGNQRDLAFAERDRLGGVADMDEVGRAAGIGRIHVPQFETHVIGHRQRPEPRRIAGAEIAVDVALAEAGVLDRSLGRLGMQLGERLVFGLPRRVLIDPDDIGLVLDAHRGLFLPIDLKLTIARWDTVRRPRSIPDCRDAASACFEYPPSGPYQLITTRRRPMTFLNSSLRLTSCGCKSRIFCGIGRLWKIEGRRYDPDTVARLHFDFELAAPRRSIGRREYPIDAGAGTPVVEAGYVELRNAIRG